MATRHSTTGLAPGPSRTLLMALGSICMALGIMGAFIPGMPCTIFLLAASYCYARSSPLRHRRLLRHRQLGPPIRRLLRNPGRARAIAVGSLWTGVLFSYAVLALVGKVSTRATLTMIAVATIGTIIVLVTTSGAVTVNRPGTARRG